MNLEALQPAVLAGVLRHDVAEMSRRDAQDLLWAVEHMQDRNSGLALDLRRISERLLGRLPLLEKMAQALEEQ